MSNRPEQFILTTDYGTLKNDATGTISLLIPTGATIPALGFVEYSNTLEIGTRNAGTRVQMSSSAESDNWTPGHIREVLIRARHNTTGNPVFDYYQAVNLERIDPTTVRLYCRIGNPNNFSITIVSAAQTVTANVATFLSPFN